MKQGDRWALADRLAFIAASIHKLTPSQKCELLRGANMLRGIEEPAPEPPAPDGPETPAQARERRVAEIAKTIEISMARGREL